MSVEGWRRSSGTALFAIASLVSGCYGAGAGRSLGFAEVPLRTAPVAPRANDDADRQTITVASDKASKKADLFDDNQVESAFKEIIGSRVAGITIQRTADGASLHIDARANDDRRNRPLFVIDGVPLAADYGVTIPTLNLARVDLLTDSTSTSAYGPRATSGVVLVTLRNR